MPRAATCLTDAGGALMTALQSTVGLGRGLGPQRREEARAMTTSRVACAWRLVRGVAMAAIAALARRAPACRRACSARRRRPLPGSSDTELGRIAAASVPAPVAAASGTGASLSGFRLLSWSAQSLYARIELARRAQRSLDLQYYELRDDETGRLLMRTLRDAALRGVRVRLLLDDLYTAGSDPVLSGLAAFPNVEVRLFNPFPVGRGSLGARLTASLFDLGRVNHRMHNKLFIADGVMAVAGGRNIANEYFHGRRGGQLHRPRRVRGRSGGAAAGGVVRPVLEQRVRLSAAVDRVRRGNARRAAANVSTAGPTRRARRRPRRRIPAPRTCSSSPICTRSWLAAACN